MSVFKGTKRSSSNTGKCTSAKTDQIIAPSSPVPVYRRLKPTPPTTARKDAFDISSLKGATKNAYQEVWYPATSVLKISTILCSISKQGNSEYAEGTFINDYWNTILLK